MHSLKAEMRTVDNDRIFCRFQRRHRAGSISRIPSPNTLQKGGKANIHPLIFQLLIASLRSNLGAGSEKNFDRGIGKNDSPHIPAIGYQTRRPTEPALQLLKTTANQR